MRYYVLSSDGQRYGPADIPTLRQWVQEGRIVSTTMLEEEIGSARLSATGVPGLFDAAPQNPYTRPSNPYQSTQDPSAYSPPNPGQQQQPNLSQNPYASGANYYRNAPGGMPGYDGMAQRNVNNSWVGGAIGLGLLIFGICCFISPMASIGLSIWGMSCGKQARDNGHPGGQGAYIFNIVVLVLACIGLAFSLFLFGVGSFMG